MQPIEWKAPVEIAMPDGVTYQIRPGFRGRGVAVIPLDDAGPETGGRRVGEATLALRERLARDAKAGRLGQPDAYAVWLAKSFSSMTARQARQAAYRELRRHGWQASGPGRPPSAPTLELRQRLEKDAQKGALREAAFYAKWMARRYADLSKAAAQQTVYRELAKFG